jgi:hypothetical protein
MDNTQKWTDFLSSFTPSKYSYTKNLKISTKSNIRCLATTFAGKLLGENDDIPEVLQTDTNEHVEEASESDEIINPTSMENDIKKPSSSWKISDIEKYIRFDDCVIKIKMPTKVPSNLEKIYEEVQTTMRRHLKIVKGSDLKQRGQNSGLIYIMQLISKTRTEIGTRIMLDVLLVPLCSALDLQLEVEKTINCDFLPSCRFDYCIRKGEHIIGCIEAKSVTRLINKSIAQAVIQLIILQTLLLQPQTPKVDISEFPVFAIVTDGHRFIYMQLKGSSLGFEHDEGKLKIREVEKESDFKDIVRHIMLLVEGDPIN